jgi:Protein of unknown function (DUF3667)
VSHQPERKEKNCLNCGAEVNGRFCHDCGQENVVTHQGFWALTKHFVFDVIHFDGKFFHTLLYLFTKPGFVAKQYVQGKRISYLDPIRMYLFTSALFFLFFFSISKVHINENSTSGPLDNVGRLERAAELRSRLTGRPSDSARLRRIALLADTSRPYHSSEEPLDGNSLTIDGKSFRSVQEYDSTQAALPAGLRDPWLASRLVRQGLHVNEKYERKGEMITAFLETFFHKLPIMLFISLPFFALILKLLYSRRKSFYYSDHAVFTLYHYIFSFIVLLLMIGSVKLSNTLHWGIFGFVTALLCFGWLVYLFLEMRRFYGQSFGKTLGKFLLLNLGGFFILLILFLIFLLFSIFQI